MEHLLFAAYLILFAWLVTKTKFFTGSGLSKPQLVIIFLVKVMAGIFYGWIGVYYGKMAKMVDTWGYHYESLQECALLKAHPVAFFSSIFHTNYDNGYLQFLSTHNSWWNDVKATFLIKIMAIFDLFSFGHYYVNVIFYSFLSLFGSIALYRVMRAVFPSARIVVLFGCFLLPSTLYWTSGLHKEGLIFLSLSLIIYHFYFGLKETRIRLYRVVPVLLSFFMILIFRNFLVLCILPALFAWILTVKFKTRPLLTFLSVFAGCLIFFFTAKYLSPRLDLPAAVVERQHQFSISRGGSSVPVHQLEPNFKSFVVNFPQALSLSSLRPFPSDAHHLLSLASALEINCFLLLFIIFLVWRKKGSHTSPFLLFCLFISFSLFLVVGYTVDNLGAIVRYRSVILPLLVIPMAASTDWKRINQLVSGNIKNNNNI